MLARASDASRRVLHRWWRRRCPRPTCGPSNRCSPRSGAPVAADRRDSVSVASRLGPVARPTVHPRQTVHAGCAPRERRDTIGADRRATRIARATSVSPGVARSLEQGRRTAHARTVPLRPKEERLDDRGASRDRRKRTVRRPRGVTSAPAPDSHCDARHPATPANHRRTAGRQVRVGPRSRSQRPRRPRLRSGLAGGGRGAGRTGRLR